MFEIDIDRSDGSSTFRVSKNEFGYNLNEWKYVFQSPSIMA